MTGRTEQLPISLPAGLDELPPGGELAEVLAGVGAGDVSGYDAVSLAEVAYRQATYSRSNIPSSCGRVRDEGAGIGGFGGARGAPVGVSSDEVRAAVELSTLMGLDRHPAELPGLGYIPAGAALEMLPCLVGAQWRFVICDTDGVPICSGITSARPRLDSLRGATGEPRGRGIVELQLNQEQLRQWRCAITVEQHTAWSDVVLDICDLIGTGFGPIRITGSTTQPAG